MRETNEGDLAGDEVPSEEVSGSSVASDQSAHRSASECCLLGRPACYLLRHRLCVLSVQNK